MQAFKQKKGRVKEDSAVGSAFVYQKYLDCY